MGVCYYIRVPSEYGSVPEWPKGTDCKSAGDAFGGSNPPAPTKQKDRCESIGLFAWWGRIPESADCPKGNSVVESPQPRPRELRIAFRSGMSGERSLCCSSFPQRTRCAGLRCGEWVRIPPCIKKEPILMDELIFYGGEGGTQLFCENLPPLQHSCCRHRA